MYIHKKKNPEKEVSLYDDYALSVFRKDVTRTYNNENKTKRKQVLR